MSVAKEIGKGTLFNAIAKYSGIVINLIVTGVLARMLSADAFGIVALTTVMTTFFDLLGNMGFGPAIIQKKNLNNIDLASIYNLTAIIAIFLALLCFLSAPFMSKVYDSKELVVVMQILSTQVLFSILNVVPYSLLLKSKQFGFIAATSVICQFSFGIIAVTTAVHGLGIYSLLVVPVGSSLFSFIIYSIKSKKIFGSYLFAVLKYNSIKKVLSFSVFQFLFNIVNYFSRNLDKLLIGNHFSMSNLGYYEKSYRLMQLPVSNISSVLAPTIQPILSQFQNEREHFYYYTNSLIKILAYIGFSITPLLYFCAKDIIIIVFGSNWIPAIPIFKVLAISVCFQIVDSPTGSLLQASNSPKILFLSGLICACLNVICILVGVYYFKSLLSLAWMLDLAFFINLIIDMTLLFRIVLKIHLREIIHIFVHPIIILLIVSIFLYLIIKISIINVILNFIVCALVTVIVSIGWAIFVGIINLKNIHNITK